MAPGFTADPCFVATRELFARAAGRVTLEDVEHFAPSDPGYPKYVAAFQAIVRHGEVAMRPTFAVTETIGLTRWTHASGLANTRRFRWFRVLTSATETLMAESDCPNYGIATLLVDAFALAELGDGAAPVDLLSEVCREIAAHPHLAVTSQEVPFCLLGQLLLASVDRLEDAAIEGLCAELEERHRRHDEWWEDEYGEAADLPRSHAFLWGITYFDQLHPVWLDLVEARFPTEPPAAAALRRRLLHDGAPWAKERRPMS